MSDFKSVNPRSTQIIGWIASLLSTLTYASFIDQIKLNINGHPGSLFVALCIVLASATWCVYGGLKKDLPIVICNAIGVVFCTITLWTAISPSSFLMVWSMLSGVIS